AALAAVVDHVARFPRGRDHPVVADAAAHLVHASRGDVDDVVAGPRPDPIPARGTGDLIGSQAPQDELPVSVVTLRQIRAHADGDPVRGDAAVTRPGGPQRACALTCDRDGRLTLRPGGHR